MYVIQLIFTSSVFCGTAGEKKESGGIRLWATLKRTFCERLANRADLWFGSCAARAGSTPKRTHNFYRSGGPAAVAVAAIVIVVYILLCRHYIHLYTNRKKKYVDDEDDSVWVFD
ncbi:hypothetical protein QTP88_022364 [Uroleucon formosanum]